MRVALTESEWDVVCEAAPAAADGGDDPAWETLRSTIEAVLTERLATAYDEGLRGACPDVSHTADRPYSPNPYKQVSA